MTVSGKSHIEGNLNCVISEDLLIGRKFCFPVYRNPGGTRAEKNEYVEADMFDLKYFSVVE